MRVLVILLLSISTTLSCKQRPSEASGLEGVKKDNAYMQAGFLMNPKPQPRLSCKWKNGSRDEEFELFWGKDTPANHTRYGAIKFSSGNPTVLQLLCEFNTSAGRYSSPGTVEKDIEVLSDCPAYGGIRSDPNYIGEVSNFDFVIQFNTDRSKATVVYNGEYADDRFNSSFEENRPLSRLKANTGTIVRDIPCTTMNVH